MRPLQLLLSGLALSGMVAAQEDGLTNEERLQTAIALHRIQPVPEEKCPIDADLNLQELPEIPMLRDRELRVVPSDPPSLQRAEFELIWAHSNATPLSSPTPARLANYSEQAAPPPVSTQSPRLLISFSRGLNIGKGLYAGRSTACNVTPVPQGVGQGDVEYAANVAGIAMVGIGEAQNSNQLQRNRSMPVVGSQITQGLSGFGTVLIAAKVVAASGTWGAVLGGISYAAGYAQNYFKSVTPADLNSRFSGSTTLTDGLGTQLPPRGDPHDCQTWQFFARYSGKIVKAEANIPVY